MTWRSLVIACVSVLLVGHAGQAAELSADERLRGIWVDEAAGAAAWRWEFRYDGTFVGSGRQAAEPMAGLYTLEDDLVALEWINEDGAAEEAWARVIQNDGHILRFRFSSVEHRLAQSSIVQLRRPGVGSGSETEVVPAPTKIETGRRNATDKQRSADGHDLVRLTTKNGVRLVGVILEEHRSYIIIKTKRTEHRIRRRDIERIQPATAKQGL